MEDEKEAEDAQEEEGSCVGGVVAFVYNHFVAVEADCGRQPAAARLAAVCGKRNIIMNDGSLVAML